MKLSTQKIIGLESAATVVLLLLALLPLDGILREYLQILVVVGATGLSAAMLGWAKPRARDVKMAAIVIILVAVLFQAASFVLLGMKLGFVENVYRFGLDTLGKVFLPMILMIVAQEILRGQMIERGRGSWLAIVWTLVCLILMEICFILPLYDYQSLVGWIDMAMAVIFPTILTNILMTYVACMFDYRINIAYRLIMELPIVMLPIWPDVSEYLISAFEIAMTVLLLMGLVSFRRWEGLTVMQVEKRKPKRQITDSTAKRRRILQRVGLGVAGVLLISYVALMSGLFKWFFLAVGSDSMRSALARGDMVLVRRTDKYDELKEGDVLVYNHSNVVIVHRIMEVKEEGGVYQFVTKGDANPDVDVWTVQQGDVIGTAEGKIVTLGYPTLWLNELFNGGEK